MKPHISKYTNHVIAVILFFVLSMAYYSPLLEGKKVRTTDDLQYLGMSKEIRDFREEHKSEPLWTNSTFSGMPAYQISRKFKGNIFEFIDKQVLRVPKPAQYLFMTLLGFYLMLLMFKVDQRISILGAIAFGFSSYFLIIIAAGHNAKAAAIAYMAPMIGGIYYTYRHRVLPGLIVFAIAFGLQLAVNHFQITYYTFLIAFALAAIVFYEDIMNKLVGKFFIKSIYLIIVGLIVLGTSFPNLFFTYDYGKDSTRGKPVITLENEKQTATGLDKDYALQWSYGIDETLSLLIPNIKGGASIGTLPENSEIYKLFKQSQGAGYAKRAIKQMPTYWGTQPSTSGPVYVGAVIMFLFVLGLFTYKKKLKWWLLTITVLSIMLAWGKNFEWFSHLFLDFFPGYNKFRAVTMILVIAEFSVPLLAFLGLSEIIKGKIEKPLLIKYLRNSLFIVGGICLLFILFPKVIFSFESPIDINYLNQQGGEQFIDALQSDRALLLRNDSFRSLIFVLLPATLILLHINKKINSITFFVLLGTIILVDMWGIDKRYMNNDNFVTKREINEPFIASQADQYILKDSELNFRVLNLTVSPFQDASTSYFHNSLGGYHGAKMKRYQNLIDFELIQNINELTQGFQTPENLDHTMSQLNGLNMLNTKYIIYSKERPPLENTHRFGPAWIVENVDFVANADQELLKSKSADLSKTAVINEKFKDKLQGFKKDSTATITLVNYLPNHLTYEFNASKDVLTVFSEIYYKDWKAYIDGKEVNHYQANFLLRAMKIPSGNHKVEFKFEPAMYETSNNIARASSIFIVLLVVVGIFFKIKNSRNE